MSLPIHIEGENEYSHTCNHEHNNGDVRVLVDGDEKSSHYTGNLKAFCVQCKRDITVVYVKPGTNGQVAEGIHPWKDTEGFYHEADDYEKCKKDSNYEQCKRLLNGRKRKNKIQQLWTQFLGGCTLHGFHYCFGEHNNPPFRRIIWILLLLGAFALFFEKCTESIIHFFEYPFTTTTLLIYENSLIFPAISLCNYNDARLSKMNGTLMHEIYVKKLQGENVTQLTNQLTGEKIQEALSKSAHSHKEMITFCKWNEDVNCSWENFTVFKNVEGDVCFMFNSGRNKRPLIVSNTGQKKGLKLQIDVQHYDYYYGVSSAGFKVILHDQEETPVRMQGYSVSPGFTTYIELKKRQITNLPSPYKTRCAMPPLKYFPKSRYTKSKCFLDRLTQDVVGRCKCKEWFMPGDAPICPLNKMMDCLWPRWVFFRDNKIDNCPVACDSIEYSAQLSYAQYPSNVFADQLAKERGLKGTKEENRLFLRDNLLEIFVFYEDLTYYAVNQVPSYDLYSLLGDVGGQIGLFLGASILTAVEYFDLLAMVLYAKYKYRD